MKHTLTILCLLVFTACGTESVSTEIDTDTVGSSSAAMPMPTYSASSAVNVAVDTTFTNAQAGFQVLQPANWSVEDDATLTMPDAEYKGTAFVVPTDWREGTVLQNAYVHITSLPSCMENSDVQTVNVDGFEYFYSEWEEGATGTANTGKVYQVGQQGTCLQLVLYQERCNIGEACNQEEFTRDDELQGVVNDMFDSLQAIAE